LTAIRLYVEGGGPGSYAKCRRAFKALFLKVVPDKEVTVIACGARDDALSDFGLALSQRPHENLYVLIDSEAPVVDGHGPIRHLQAEGKQVRGAQEAQVHLMVECMEAWFLADRSCLRTYYGNRLDEGALPGNPNIEAVNKTEVLRGLARAARNTPKKRYDKGRDSFELLSRIDPSTLRRAAAHAERLFAAAEQDP